MSDQKLPRILLLGLTGFIVGVTGVSAFSSIATIKDPRGQALAIAGAEQRESLPDAMCRIDNASDDAPIYFVSCGGIY